MRELISKTMRGSRRFFGSGLRKGRGTDKDKKRVARTYYVRLHRAIEDGTLPAPISSRRGGGASS